MTAVVTDSTDLLMHQAGWTVPGLLRARCAATPALPALNQRSLAGEWTASDWKTYGESVRALSVGFQDIGLVPGDRIGLLARSSREWDYAHQGILAAGGVTVGLDPYAPSAHLREIAVACGMSGLVVDDEATLGNVDETTRRALRFIVSLTPSEQEEQEGVTPFHRLLQTEAGGKAWNLAQPDSPATIIFTSGTTGSPRGIEYSHRQICQAIAAILKAFPNIGDETRLACWLPLSNLFQRMINFCAIGKAAQNFYVPDPREVMQRLPEIEPHVFIGVPRFYEKLHAGILDALEKKAPWQRRLAAWSLDIGNRHARKQRDDEPISGILRLQHRLADILVLGKLRHILGSNLEFMISGSAPMPTWLLEWFHAIGLPVLEAYGLSENIIPVALNRPDRFRFGTVGHPLDGCTVRLADDGELLVAGPGTFHGYLGENTADGRITANGFLSTGDYASIDADGFIRLIGRKSEIFKTSTGRRIAPASVEGCLCQLPQFEHVAVFGAGRTAPIALATATPASWIDDAHGYCASLRAAARQAIGQLPAYSRPNAIAVTRRTFSIESGELTTNLKLRRHAIESRYSSEIEELVAQLGRSAGAPFEAESEDGQTRFMSL